MQSTQNLMLNLELRSHAELDALLYSEGLLCKRFFGAFLREVDCDWRSAFRIHGEREDDAVAWIGRVGEVFAAVA